MFSSKAFTLIELIVVIAIIAILAAIIAPNAFKAIEKAKVAKTRGDLMAIKTAFAALYADTAKFPNGCPAFVLENPETPLNSPWAGLIDKPPLGQPAGPYSGSCEWKQADLDTWDGPYLERNVIDFWKQPYWYDPDYGGCASCDWCYCDSSSAGYSKRASSCPGNYWFPALLSLGPDGAWYSCDDIFVVTTLD